MSRLYEARGNLQWNTGLTGLKIDLRELGKSLFPHTKKSWEMGLGHVESIFYTYWKGEEWSREKKEVNAVEQNSISSSKSWVIIKSVALLRSNTVDTCLSMSLSFHYTRQSACGPLAASSESEFSSCTPYMIDADCHRWNLRLDWILNELHLWKAAAIQTSIIQPFWFLQRPVYSIFYELKLSWRNALFKCSSIWLYSKVEKEYQKSPKDLAKIELERQTHRKTIKETKIKFAWKNTKIHECGTWKARDVPNRSVKRASSE